MVCEDTSHQAIFYNKGEQGERRFEVNEAECVGCNLCVSICPVPDTISMRSLQPGEVDARTGKTVTGEYANWTTHPNNPARVTAQVAP
ncbi:dihydropyrimidine dehydrogenase subunit B [compost metagenome]